MLRLVSPFVTARVSATAAMLVDAAFRVGSSTVSPFALAPWVARSEPVDARLPGHVRLLGAEFVAVPFGSAGRPPELDPAWRAAVWSDTQEPPHGLAADRHWQLVAHTSRRAVLELHLPEGGPLHRLRRSITVAQDQPAIDFELLVESRADALVPLALHPVFRLPAAGHRVRLRAPAVRGFTYPGRAHPRAGRPGSAHVSRSTAGRGARYDVTVQPGPLRARPRWIEASDERNEWEVRIESVEFFYASMPTVTLDVDGSQDALLVRVTDDSGVQGWGECEASPLTSIAAFVAPRSHGVCQPVADSVQGERLDRCEDIPRIAERVARNSADLLQAPHTFSGIEIALWDLLGRRLGEPVWHLLGYQSAHTKTPYASMLFGDTAADTMAQVASSVAQGFRAVKLGWGHFGAGTVQDDADHLVAAREAIGPEGLLLVDAGQIWGEDVEAAKARIPVLTQTRVAWIEEPFHPHNFAAHAALAIASESGPTRLAGGESAHSARMATNLIDYGRIGYVQIDTGRIGGIAAAHQVALHAERAGTQYVNHTFTSHLALSASLQPYAGLAGHRLCEYPVQLSPLARAIAGEPIKPDANGEISVPSVPGLGVEVDLDSVLPYLREVRIAVDGAVIYTSPRPTPASLVADRSV